MKQHLSSIALLVRDYDEAIAFYVNKLGFKLIEDTRLSPTKRWVLVALPGARETRLLLAKAVGARQRARVGDQTGGRVFLFLRTDDFKRDYARYKARGIAFIEKPRREKYGTVAVFEDLDGNLWDLIQPNARGTRR